MPLAPFAKGEPYARVSFVLLLVITKKAASIEAAFLLQSEVRLTGH